MARWASSSDSGASGKPQVHAVGSNTGAGRADRARRCVGGSGRSTGHTHPTMSTATPHPASADTTPVSTCHESTAFTAAHPAAGRAHLEQPARSQPPSPSPRPNADEGDKRLGSAACRLPHVPLVETVCSWVSSLVGHSAPGAFATDRRHCGSVCRKGRHRPGAGCGTRLAGRAGLGDAGKCADVMCRICR